MSNSKLYSAIVKSVTGRLSTYLIQFISLAIYSRLFTPEEFGVIASIQVFVVFFLLLADIGIGPAIINEEEFNSNKRNGVFSVTGITGFVLSILFFCLSYLLNDFYNGYEYQNIAFLVSVTIFFSTLNIVPKTSLNKDAKFIELAIIDIIAEVLSLVLVYFLYTKEYGVIALATRPVTQSLTKFSLTWYLSFWTSLGRASFGKQLYQIKILLRFSLYQFGFNFINYFSRNLDNILIAKYFGMASIGVYEKAYQLMRYPLLITTFAMTPAIQPILTKLRSNMPKIVLEHNLLTRRLLVISLPISAFIFINAKVIILFLFGEQWFSVAPLIKIFAFMIPIQAILSTSGAFFQVVNQPKLLFISGAISALVNVTAIILGIILGDMKFVAIFLVLGFTFNFIQTYYILFKYCFLTTCIPFYSGLVKAFFIMICPIFVYAFLHLYVSFNEDIPLVIDILIQSIMGIIAIMIFIPLIKKVI